MGLGSEPLALEENRNLNCIYLNYKCLLNIFFSYFPFSMAVAGRRGLVIFLFCVLSSYTVYARIRKGKYSFLQNFCTGKEIYNAIPWDCSGYVHCHGNTAFWIECPTNLYYSAEAKTCMWPTSLNRPCPPLKG